ncbi:MAG TPA: hypothetical protein VNQ77_14005 [Frankiaceae bacterium]|nr:hypothetical protein [Frankiaceae bacterium]
MTRALLAVALSALAALPAPARAAAGPGRPVENCSYSWATSPFADGRVIAYIGGAAVPVADGADPRAGRVTCTARNGHNHTDPALVAVSSLTTPGVAAVPYTLVEHAVPPLLDWLTVCLTVEVEGGGTFYWDDAAETWSADPDVLCYDMWDDDLDPVFDVVDEAVRTADDLVVQHVDPPLCAALGGDAEVAGEPFWDCPPYGSR